LKERKCEFVLVEQVLKSGTSVGANVHEAICGQSSKDFLAKLGIALKEAHETDYWLGLLFSVGDLTEEQYSSIRNDCLEILRILTSIINTTKRNMEQGRTNQK
jgi:four helix bundle protein